MDTISTYILAAIMICGVVSNLLPQGWALTKILTKIGALTFRAVTKVPLVAVFLLLLIPLQACAGTLEESRGQISLAKAAPGRCASLSNAAKWEGALAEGGAVLTGATGIAAWPVQGDGRVALAITSGVVGAGTAVAVYLHESDATSWAKECTK
jgi:hypothetical protein